MRGSTNAETMTTDTATALSGKQPTMSVVTTTSGPGYIQRYGKLVVLKIYALSVTSIATFQSAGITAPSPINYASGTLTSDSGGFIGVAFLDPGHTSVSFHSKATGWAYGTMVYFTNDP